MNGPCQVPCCLQRCYSDRMQLTRRSFVSFLMTLTLLAIGMHAPKAIACSCGSEPGHIRALVRLADESRQP